MAYDSKFHQLLLRLSTSCSRRRQQLRRFSTHQHEHHRAGFRARASLAKEWFRTHGFWLAPVNPLRKDALMTEHIEDTFPLTLRPLVKPFVQARMERSENRLPKSMIGTDEEPVLNDLLDQYCSGVGYQFMHCATQEERDFFIEEIESAPSIHNPIDSIWCYEQVLRAGEWERLLAKRYPTCRRFSLEGLESAVIAINAIFDIFSATSDPSQHRKRVVMGSLHRGRVNILHTVLQKPVSDLLHEWDPTKGPTYDDINFGHSADILTKQGQSVHVSLLAMPAHLESQDASVAGKARGHMVARMLQQHEYETISEQVRQSVLPLVLHGDASFCGQGIVSETLQLSTFSDFECGGTVHLILNNQIGFTCETQLMRTSQHRLVNVSDLALGIRAPVLHVNAERPRDVLFAASLATRYRQQFGKDVVLDLWGYRKHGHNEVDEPRLTNVTLYQEVDRHQPAADLFLNTLTGTVQQDCQDLKEEIEAEYKQVAGQKRVEEAAKKVVEYNTGEWMEFGTYSATSDVNTGVELEKVKAALVSMSKVPEGSVLHPVASRTIQRRAEILEAIRDMHETSEVTTWPLVDWGTAELLALSTLSQEGRFCRLCGQDSRRGTFCQRNAVWYDAETGKLHHALSPRVQVVDSPLSELGVLGFEHGFSLASPNFLVLWEAQFADFVNNSQTLIDTMIASEKEKFGLQSNLVLLLPHGYDGMGPEHSSARLERFLTLHTDTPEVANSMMDDSERVSMSNFTVIYPSTPANYFHLLRRSFTWDFRRPMVVLTPKRTLRLAQAASPLVDMLQRHDASASTFAPVLGDSRSTDVNKVRSIAICSGELYYDVLKLLEGVPSEVSDSVAILRIEQLAPFPLWQLKIFAERYPCAQRAVWMQEEPKNMGALRFVIPFLECAFAGKDLSSPISRPVTAAPAVGNPREHLASQVDLHTQILNWIQGV